MTTLAMDKQIDFISFSRFTPSAFVLTWDNFLTEQYVPRSASISSSVNTALAFLLSKNIKIEDATSVEYFLTNYSGVVAHLYDIPDKIIQYFGKSEIKVGLFSDPSANEERPELYFEIETALSPEEANEKLSKINREWILNSDNKDLMDLNITLKFT